MKIADLRRACKKSIERADANGVPHGYVQLILPLRKSRYDQPRLLGRSGPKGTLIGVLDAARMLVDYRADVVLAWLRKNEGRWLTDTIEGGIRPVKEP